MDNPNITMEEYNRIEEEKARRHAIVFDVKLTSREALQCKPIVNSVYVLDFKGLTPGMRQDLAKRLRMVYTKDDGQEMFVSHAWRRHAEGRKSNARLLRGHFIGRLAHHFGQVSDDGLRGLFVVTRKLPLIDMGTSAATTSGC
nr:hypothetical protein [Tanacetum cinerariifolium]